LSPIDTAFYLNHLSSFRGTLYTAASRRVKRQWEWRRRRKGVPTGLCSNLCPFLGVRQFGKSCGLCRASLLSSAYRINILPIWPCVLSESCYRRVSRVEETSDSGAA